MVGNETRTHVLACSSKFTQKLYAVRVYYKSKILKDGFLIKKIKDEMEYMKEIDQAEHCSYKNFSTKLEFIRESKNFVYIGTDLYLGGNLKNDAFSAASLKEEQVIFIIAQAVIGVYGLHYRGITHNNLKPESIYVSKEGHLVIGDLGFASRGELISGCREVGTPGYVCIFYCYSTIFALLTLFFVVHKLVLSKYFT